MISRIVYFVEYPLDERDVKRYGFAALKSHGFAVEAWDFTPFLFPVAFEQARPQSPVIFPGLRQFDNERQALAAIDTLGRECLVLCFVSYRVRSLPIFRALAECRVPYAAFVANTIPSVLATEGRWRRRVRKLAGLRRLSAEQIRDAIARRMASKMPEAAPAAMLLAGGVQSARRALFPTSNQTEVVWLHTLDYDIYLEHRDKPAAVDERCAVFLDQYMPFHPDHAYAGAPSPVTAEEYYPLLDGFFTRLENDLGMRVVIAAHPRSDYRPDRDYFGGRIVRRDSTVELVKQSRLVIAHGTTALNYAVLFRKPAILVTTDKLKPHTDGFHVDVMASWLGKSVLNLNRLGRVDWQQELVVDEDAYDGYQAAYIKKPGSPSLPFWDLFALHIKRKNEGEPDLRTSGAKGCNWAVPPHV